MTSKSSHWKSVTHHLKKSSLVNQTKSSAVLTSSIHTFTLFALVLLQFIFSASLETQNSPAGVENNPDLSAPRRVLFAPVATQPIADRRTSPEAQQWSAESISSKSLSNGGGGVSAVGSSEPRVPKNDISGDGGSSSGSRKLNAQPDQVTVNRSTRSPPATDIPSSPNNTDSSTTRQTRSTTRKQITTTSVSSIAESTTGRPLSLKVSTDEEDDDLEDENDMSVERQKRRFKKPGIERRLNKSNSNDAETVDEDAEDTEKERKRRRRLKNRHRNTTVDEAYTGSTRAVGTTTASTTTTSQGSTDISTRQPASTVANSSTSTKDREQPMRTTRRRRPLDYTTPVATTSTTTTTIAASLADKNKKSKGNSLIGDSEHDYYDDYEDDAPNIQAPPDAPNAKPLDLSSIKPVGLDHWNETLATNQSQVSSTERPRVTSLEPPNQSPILVKLDTVNQTIGALDPRSPSAQPSGGFAKRLSSILSDSKSRPRPTTVSPSTPTTSTSNSGSSSSTTVPSTISKFAYSKPYSTTTMMTPVTNSLRESNLVVQTELMPNQQSLQELNNISVSREHLDWSKLVKVVFKSALDNQTVYTVVMNSSELSNHPINDWSTELPHLLQRDFEKLIQKWSNIFPFYHLMTDLGQIIISKVSTSPSANVSSTLMSKLNETFPINTTATTSTNSSLPHSAQSLAMLASSTTHKPMTATLLVPTPTSLPYSNANHSSNSDKPLLNTTQMASLNSTSPDRSNLTLINLAVTNATESISSNTTTSPQTTMNTDTTTSMTSASVRPLNISMDYVKSTKPWSSSHDLSKVRSVGVIAPANVSNPNFVTVGSIPINDLSDTNTTASLKTLSSVSRQNSHENRSVVEIMRDMNIEHLKIENNVKEQATSLRHFIIICSVSVVLATSLAVAIIVFLLK